MKPLRPITILVAGSPLMGLAATVAFAIAGQDALTARGTFVWFVAGTTMGALFLSPIAAVEALRGPLSYLLGPYTFSIHWHVSLTMATALGYVLASGRLGHADGITVLALTVLFIGAMVKFAIGIIEEAGVVGKMGR